MTFSFIQAQHRSVEIDVLRYERQPTGDYDDDNWLTVQVRVIVAGFRGTVDAAFLTGELAAFLSELRSLYQSLSGAAQFTTLEEQLHMRLTGDGKGHIQLVGEIADQPGIGNRLRFTLQFDQSQLRESIHELEKVTIQFPVRAA